MNTSPAFCYWLQEDGGSVAQTVWQWNNEQCEKDLMHVCTPAVMTSLDGNILAIEFMLCLNLLPTRDQQEGMFGRYAKPVKHWTNLRQTSLWSDSTKNYDPRTIRGGSCSNTLQYRLASISKYIILSPWTGIFILSIVSCQHTSPPTEPEHPESLDLRSGFTKSETQIILTL